MRIYTITVIGPEGDSLDRLIDRLRKAANDQCLEENPPCGFEVRVTAHGYIAPGVQAFDVLEK